MLALIPLVAFSGQGWTLVCGGDIMLNGLKPSADRLAAVAQIFRRASVSMANLEVPMTHARKPTSGKSASEVRAHKQFILKADPAHAKFLSNWGFKVLTQGNNHAMDYRWAGLSEMLGLLDHAGISHTGAGKDRGDAWHGAWVEVGDDQKVGIGAALAFAGEASAQKCTPATESSPGVATLFHPGKSLKPLKALVASLRRNGGPVVLFLHWGIERAKVPAPYQVALGRACIDAGADAVIGAHPHVLQGGELYKGRPILYSLGNLVAPKSGDTGLVELKFEGRMFKEFRFLPFRGSGGTVVEYKPRDRERAKSNFHALCELIQARYRSSSSKSID